MPNKQQEWNVLLCDDEPLVLDRLLALSQKTLLSQYNAVFHCAAGAEALPDSSVQLHIAVLDIVLKQDNGISLARSIVEKFPECQIIFVSGYPQYVSDVYDVPHLGMVLKEQLENQLPKFLLRAASVLDSAREETLTVLSNRVPLQLRLSGIVYLERKDHITYLHLLSGHHPHPPEAQRDPRPAPERHPVPVPRELCGESAPCGRPQCPKLPALYR